ncbi:MAG: elongation factor P [Bdellovibrionales bacterium]|nr:elongation factor P [Bdellovibrionales bacterium]
MAQYATNQFRKGLKIEIEKVPYEIVDFQHVSPGKGRAFTRTKVKNMLNGNVTEKTITSGDKVDAADTEQVEMQFLYKDSAGYNFMNQTSFDQSVIQEEILGDAIGFLQENLVLQVQYYNGRPIGVELPTFVTLKIVETDPAFKGDTVTGGTKPAKLETGATVQVPFHLKEGDTVKVDTRDHTYVEKVNK